MKAQISPAVTGPPPTEFPYPPSTDRLDLRVGSCSTQIGSDTSPSSISDIEEADLKPKIRPALHKSATDNTRHARGRFSFLAPQERKAVTESSKGRTTANLHADSSWDSSSEWSSENEPPRRLQKTHSDPAYTSLSNAELNQVRQRPRRQSRNDFLDRFSVANHNFRSRGKNSKTDGRLKISVDETANSGYLAKALGATIHHHLQASDKPGEKNAQRTPSGRLEKHDVRKTIPKLNIVIMVIGSRGDIQPFLKIGKLLKEKHGHRVRIATHPTFKKFVEQDIGLEFFSVGGDPSELMAFMVKNPGLIPSMDTVKAGEIGKRRDSMFEMFQGFWRACINATDDEKNVANLEMMGDKYPFVADAIIANPPSFAHFHCAERLGIPLHLVFTFPYSPTQAFPHPLANIKNTNVDQNYTNFMSYPLVELMTWQGLGDLVNRFRTKTLGLEPVSTLWAAGQLSRLKVPTTYLWSPGLVPKPEDWGPEIDIAGYVFLDLASSFKPPESLLKFLEGGDAVYIGFGSISGIDDPAAFTRMVFDAIELAGVRALVSKGWGGMGEGMEIPEHIYMLDNIPHDWLFPKVVAVIHHGGAGSTAAGLKCGKPTMIIPFFGDQPFWGAMVAKSGAGARESIPFKKLTAETFAEGIKECLTPEAKQKAQALAKDIEAEGDGAENAINSFHRLLPLEGDNSMRCSIFDDRVAVWRVRQTDVKLSALAAELLVECKELRWQELSLIRHYDWHDFQGPGEPLTGAGGAVVSSLTEAIAGISAIPRETRKGMKKREKQKRKNQKRTVADGVVLPGQIARARVNGSLPEGDRLENHQANFAKFNIHGTAGPSKVAESDEPLDSTCQAPGTSSTISRKNSGQAPVPHSASATAAEATARGLGHSAKAMGTMPLDVLNALALGFNNAPRLYGDGSVRPAPHNITGVRSGLKAAGSGLYHGFFDGVTGLVTLPYHDTKEDGALGIATGIGKGIGGLVMKPLSGIIGVGAYVGKGLQAGIRKRVHDTRKTDRWIRGARQNQGLKSISLLEDDPQDEQSGDRLEEARRKALEIWNMQDRIKLEEARKMDERNLSFRPSKKAAEAEKEKIDVTTREKKFLSRAWLFCRNSLDQ